MTQTVLIAGSEGLLAGALAARYRADTNERVIVRSTEQAEPPERLRVDEVWWIFGGRRDEDGLEKMLASLPALGARAFNLVGPATGELERESMQRCAAVNVRCLIFHVAQLLGQGTPAECDGRSEFVSFLRVLDALVAEVEGRLPGYFRRRPLRCLAPEGAVVDLAGADDVAGALLSVSRTGPAGRHKVSGEKPTPFIELCRQVGRAWGIELTAVADEQELNAVDRHLRDRLAGIDLFGRAPCNEPGIETRRVAAPDEESRQSFLRAFRERRVEAREALKARLAVMPESLGRYTVARVPALTYGAAGRGEPPVIAVNAIGQGTAIWLPLLDCLSRRRRVVIWEMRQTDPHGRPVTFDEHCEDLHAILQQEGVGPSHLLGWCTGAKLAARYCRTHPGAVRSMVFLSGSFKHPNRAPEFDTPYERNLEVMLKAVARQPSLAERLRVVFAPAAPDSPDGEQSDDDGPALRALTELPPELQPEVRRPFRDAPTLVVYARQHLEFWSHDETACGACVRVPVLGIAGERDEVVSPAGFRAALSHFPLARYEEVAGGTHYCFYERPESVAELIEEFLAHAATQ